MPSVSSYTKQSFSLMTIGNQHLTENEDLLHVVFGATGAYGNAIVRKLLKKNLRVLAIVRNEDKASKLFPGGVEIQKVDLLDKDEVAKVCRDASVIYIANNFPWKDWTRYFLESINNIMQGTQVPRPTIVFPGNVYGYGEFQYSPVDEAHPLAARSRKGRLRNDIESLLLESHHKGRINLVLPRFADFYGPNVTNDLYGAMFRNAIRDKPAIWPVNIDVPHNFTYIEDAAEATLLLLEDQRTYGKVFHVSGPVTTARKFIEKVYQTLNKPPKIRVLSKGLLRLTSPFNSNVRGLLELLYEYEEPYHIDDSRFANRYPSFLHTPYEIGIKNTLEWFKRDTIH